MEKLIPRNRIKSIRATGMNACSEEVLSFEDHIRGGRRKKVTEWISRYLSREGFTVRCFQSGESLLGELSRGYPDLFILDIMMPGIDGIEVCRTIRKAGESPIIFVSARGEETDKIVGLELGADDYLTKPFSPRELVARVKAITTALEGFDILTRLA